MVLGANAYTETVNGIKWTYAISGGKATVGGSSLDYTAVPTNTYGAISIPSRLGGYSVTSISRYAFYGCSGLTSVTIPDSVTSIGEGAFHGCSGLALVTIGNGVTSFEHSPFCHSGLMAFAVGDGNPSYKSVSGLVLTKDESALVLGVNGVVTIPDSVTNIKDYAFYGCSGLTSVTIPDSVTRIGSYAFKGCSGLTSVMIPDGVRRIGYEAFSDCGGLMTFAVGDGNPSYKSVSDLLLTKDGGTLVFGIIGEVTIPCSVTNIKDYAFSGCSGLTKVTIPDSVTSIGQSAFYRCSSLTNVTIGNGVTSIGFNAFCGCGGLANVTIPDGVTDIEPYAFYECTSLANIIFEGNMPPKVGTNAFSKLNEDCRGIISRSASGWGKNISRTWNDLLITYPWYLVEFDPYGGTCQEERRTVDHGMAIGELPLPTRIGYGFDGWYLTSSGGNPIQADAVVVSDMKLRASWTPNKYTVTFNANGGTCGTSELSIDYGMAAGELPVPVRDNAVFLGWFTEAEGGVKVDADTVVTGELVLYAHWLFEVEPPVVVSSEGNPFRADSCEVSIECATEGAAIYYTDDGTTPRLNDDYLYTGPFTITDTTVIKAIAVFQELRSGYVTTTIEKHTLTFEEALGSVEGVAFATGGDALWSPIVYDAAKRGDICAKSGAIGNKAETWLSATVEGAGAMTFWCKTSCEHDEDNMFTWDRLMIYTNGVEIAEWRMDGETDWTERALSFEGGVNTVKWVYYKDRTGADGEDCAWIDAMTWTPSAAADPIPAVAVDADAATVNAAVDGVGFVDAAVKVVIGGSAAEYNKFKTWADGVKGVTGDALAGEAAVVANEHAAAAYLLGAERLFENEPAVEIGELIIADGESAGTTKMTVAVTIKDGERAVAVDQEKVAAMFEATGDLGDWSGAAKLTPTVTTSGTDASGKMTFVVTPGDGTAAKAFLRIRK